MAGVPWPNVVIELCTLTFAIACCYEAYKLGVARLATFIASVLFGVAVEVYFVTQYAGYSYGPFLVDPTILGGHVPVWVGCGWGVIIFAAMTASDRMGIPWGIQPAVDALLAVSIDFALDPIAEALGWWHWTRPVPPDQMFYGVPFDNFCGWLMIVGFFSLFVRIGYHLWEPGTHAWGDVLVPIGALVPCILSVAVCQFGLDAAYGVLTEPVVFAIVAATLLLAAAAALAQAAPEASPRPWYLTAVPVVFHGLLLLFLYLEGLYQAEVTLVILMPLAAFASLVGYRHPAGG